MSERAICVSSAQSATLRILILHEIGVSESKKSYVPWRLANAEIITRRGEHLQDVDHIAKIRRACLKLCHFNLGVTDP